MLPAGVERGGVDPVLELGGEGGEQRRARGEDGGRSRRKGWCGEKHGDRRQLRLCWVGSLKRREREVRVMREEVVVRWGVELDKLTVER